MLHDSAKMPRKWIGAMIVKYCNSSKRLRCFGVGRYASIAGSTFDARCINTRTSPFNALISSSFVSTIVAP